MLKIKMAVLAGIKTLDLKWQIENQDLLLKITI